MLLLWWLRADRDGRRKFVPAGRASGVGVTAGVPWRLKICFLTSTRRKRPSSA
jgi:hypothetical protein